LEMSSATRTLCGQAFGAGQHHMLGIYLQRCWVIVAFCATLLVPLFVFAAPIFKLWGIPGAMIAMIVSCWFLVISQFVYVFGGWCPDTWTGFSFVAFNDLWPAIKLSVSSGVMVWYNAILVLIAGYMKNAEIAISAFSICLNIVSWELMMCLGLQAAASVRVSNELGKGNAKAVKFSIKFILCTSISIGVFFWVLVWHSDIKLLTCSQVMKTLQIMSPNSLFMWHSRSHSTAFNRCSMARVAVGAGWQGLVAFVNVGCYYVIGIPLGLFLGYVTDLQVKGLWIGMICGVGAQTLVLSYITWSANWDDQVGKASERLNKWSLNHSEEDDRDIYTHGENNSVL
ncbi:Multi antimicrobial extrusion protein, partial [Dillenia turbinata]